MYPQEAEVVCAHLDTYASFMSNSRLEVASRKRKFSVDLNEKPAQRLAGLVGVAVDESEERRLDALIQRCNALRKAGEYLPRFRIQT